MDIVLDIADELVLDRLYAAVLPLDVFLPKIVANITASSVPQPAPSLWTSVVSSIPHPPVAHAADAAVKLAAHTSTLPSWLLKWGSPALAASAWPRDYIPRQLLSLSVITLIGIHNQVKLEIQCALSAFPGMTLLTLPWFLGEVRGYSRLYDDPEKYGYIYMVLSVPFFLVFTDYLVYWIHRILHHPLLYKRLHKPHHKWLIPTPFASHAFHPVDGYAQSVPYHLFIYLFPLHRWVYLGLFVAVNFWSIFIHDSDMITGNAFINIINGPAHHTLHHLYFTCNYGQYFTWADRWGGSYKHPSAEFDPMNDVKGLDATKAKSD
ncbi:C-5 sterol desaturase [Ceratobasidium theobromae]|uniref:C-5 sterol desaturase n=1 Tax=Ceratobasidium theobromae TaxID=1582974 RepID=A0A5N5QVL0_9AGAM|nr:C-5 sterol desaturase [Ceratobasidium theobromae]